MQVSRQGYSAHGPACYAMNSRGSQRSFEFLGISKVSPPTTGAISKLHFCRPGQSPRDNVLQTVPGTSLGVWRGAAQQVTCITWILFIAPPPLVSQAIPNIFFCVLSCGSILLALAVSELKWFEYAEEIQLSVLKVWSGALARKHMDHLSRRNI